MSATQNKSKQTGQRGEKIAQAWLQEKGYHILECNFRIRGGEIDIIATKGKSLYFIEVKTRRHNPHTSPLESLTERQQTKIIHTSETWLSRHPEISEKELLFSVISIELLPESKAQISFLENAFEDQ